MEYSAIIKHAFSTTIRRRGLWILGFLWALVGGQGLNGIRSYGFSGDNSFGEGLQLQNPTILLPTILTILGVLVCVVLVIAVAFTIVRYVVQAGAYRSLDQLERDGTEPGFRRGLREGWHRRTWRLFGQDLLVGLVSIPFIALVLGLFLFLFADNYVLEDGTFVIIVVLGLLMIAILGVVSIVIGLLSQFWSRAAVLDDYGVIASFGYAWALFKRHWGNVLVMWLLMIGIGIAFGIALIPVTLVLLALAAALGGGPGWLLYQATESAWAALAYGIPVAIVVLAIPLMFIGGLYLIFQASVWNQVYRHLTGGGQTALALPEPAGGGE